LQVLYLDTNTILNNSEFFGLTSGGQAFQSFAKTKVLSFAMVENLLIKIDNPLIFKGISMVKNAPPPRDVHGYDVTILIDMCKAVIQAKAEGILPPKYDQVAKNSQLIVNASAKAGIQGLVYALSGYDATKEEQIASFKAFIREEAREYEKEFPEQLYNEWYRIYKIAKPKRNRPWKFMHLTNNHLYFPLAKSSGKLLDLMKVLKSKGKEKQKRLHQFLSEVGVKALRWHLGNLMGIAQLSDEEKKYEENVKKIFGDPKKEFSKIEE
jgi:hypothetical protein